ncbi:MAG TPA: nucleotidyltransferase domain-containing protein [Saprospiraceae bacterium]|jgi:predicted nucleotidyltransferase|nr:MAG: DNA polymerase beta domain-containing protein [Candidatus Parvibacillus calidus]MCC6447413.1 nucleotidyltransferase domain-containing protein [Chitinophagaceae bacterium]HRN33715.1 nucleotidyltransferase domain-containing protein [Saprospiraceae bacterium]MBK7741812.1 nucleotidyltransferase domain-containing protein [Candidatus Parvibacillus calidus]QLH28406.1 MAG: nucleotidyltransferase domain-containing protein [Candidatus Parvibacillus calidus]
MITNKQKEAIIQFMMPFQPAEIGIFGSFAKGTSTKSSDIDIIVKLRKQINLFEFIDLQEGLSKVLKRKVDLITDGALNKHIRSLIASEIISIYND